MSFHEIYYNESDKKFGRSAINRVQFIQKKKNTIIVKTVPGKIFDKDYEEPFITNIVKTILGREMCAIFQYVDEIPKSESGKYRFVINEIQFAVDCREKINAKSRHNQVNYNHICIYFSIRCVRTSNLWRIIIFDYHDASARAILSSFRSN